MEEEMKKKSLRQITYGMYIVTSLIDDVVGASTVNWLSQASLNPPLVMVAIKKESNLHEAVEKSGVFAVNFLSASQKSFAECFFRKTNIDGDKINGHPFKLGTTGSPILNEVYSFVECEVSGKLPIGDHTVFVGKTVEAQYRRDDKPLEMRDTGWFYGG
jgi:flavin reductase (DIM6/NTAB) family NADH-FMN oxidoreductase RutF